MQLISGFIVTPRGLRYLRAREASPPRPAPATFPYRDHRTMAQVEGSR